jgi:PqqD family protein of HPr-rel-A system
MSDATSTREARWRIGPLEDLIWADLDDAYVVYHRPSGKTHFLNDATAELLAQILATPQTARSAGEELASREGATGDDAFFTAVAESLVRLEYLGLIERCDA